MTAVLFDCHRHIAILAHCEIFGVNMTIVLDQRAAIMEFRFAGQNWTHVDVWHSPLSRLTKFTVAQYNHVIVVISAVCMVAFIPVAALKLCLVGANM